MLLYIDPGSTNFIIQLIISAFATLALSFRFVHNHLTSFLKSLIAFFKK